MKDEHRVVEFGGGLGDVISQCFTGTYYRQLSLAGHYYSRAKVFLVTHNPAVGELFRWHPNSHLFDVVECGYWLSEQNREMRAKWGLPVTPHQYPMLPGEPVFHGRPEDEEVLGPIMATRRPFVVMAQAAGLPDRDLPLENATKIVSTLTHRGIDVVVTGKTYDRYGRKEGFSELQGEGIINCIDRLSVPGTLNLLRRSSGLVTCHSALNLAAWHMRTPQLLLYPRSVHDHHFRRPDQWSFGANFPETSHACWDDLDVCEQATQRFLTRFA